MYAVRCVVLRGPPGARLAVSTLIVRIARQPLFLIGTRSRPHLNGRVHRFALLAARGELCCGPVGFRVAKPNLVTRFHFAKCRPCPLRCRRHIFVLFRLPGARGDHRAYSFEYRRHTGRLRAIGSVAAQSQRLCFVGVNVKIWRE